MNVIFLDIDGVVNIPPYQYFDSGCIRNIERVVKETGAEIVLSSSWRSSDTVKMKLTLAEHGFTPFLNDSIIDVTIRGYKNVIKGSQLPILRGNEIKAWVDTHLVYPWHSDKSKQAEYSVYNDDGSFQKMRSNKVGVDFNYVIIDDDTDMLLEQAKFFVNTNGEVGFTEQDVQKAIEILTKKPI